MATKKEESNVSNAHIRGMEYAKDTLSVAEICCGDREKVFHFLQGVKTKIDLICREMEEEKRCKCMRIV